MTKPEQRLRWPKRIALLLLLGTGGWLFCGWLTVAVVTAPQRHPLPDTAAIAGVQVVDVETITSDGLRVRGWLCAASNERVVIRFAGRGGDRATTFGLTEYYLRRGYAVLLPDLRGTGESEGDVVGLGWPERLDVLAWVAFARERGFESIALHGQSLGAAAIAYATGDELGSLSFVVLDSAYDDIRNALANRLPFVPLPGLLLKPVEWFGAAKLDASIEALRPVDRVQRIVAPTLIVAGDADPWARPDEARRLFAACGAPVKSLAWIEGGGHEDLWQRDAGAYAGALDDFLAALPSRDTLEVPR